jgi:hypothetical protein
MPCECSRYSPFIIVEKISQAELDSLTIGQLGISRGGPADRARSIRSRCRHRVNFDRVCGFCPPFDVRFAPKATAFGRPVGQAACAACLCRGILQRVRRLHAREFFNLADPCAQAKRVSGKTKAYCAAPARRRMTAGTKKSCRLFLRPSGNPLTWRNAIR